MIKAAILGATGTVGQRMIQMLEWESLFKYSYGKAIGNY